MKCTVIISMFFLLTLNSDFSFAVGYHATDTIYNEDQVDVKPTVIGGDKVLGKSLVKIFRFPPAALNAGITGTLFMYLTIGNDGVLKNVSVKEGLGYDLDEEAIRAFMQTKVKWTSGIKNGQKVSVRIVKPFSIGLR